MFRRKNPSMGVLQAAGGVQDEQRFFYVRSARRKNERSFDFIRPFIFSKTSVCFNQNARSFCPERPFVYVKT